MKNDQIIGPGQKYSVNYWSVDYHHISNNFQGKGSQLKKIPYCTERPLFEHENNHNETVKHEL